MKEEEKGKRRRKEEEEKERRSESSLGRRRCQIFPFFLHSVLVIDHHHLPTNKLSLFPIQQYPSLMKNSPDPVWYSTP